MHQTKPLALLAYTEKDRTNFKKDKDNFEQPDIPRHKGGVKLVPNNCASMNLGVCPLGAQREPPPSPED